MKNMHKLLMQAKRKRKKVARLAKNVKCLKIKELNL